ncbi:MAG: T9SS type A sorting domain-containing protein [bacterium]|nr:T9SS type A sorting domain-containing protein [bacterium]
MIRFIFSAIIVLQGLSLGSAEPATADSVMPEIDGVLGLSAVADSTALAFWVPLAEGEALTGFSWYNNDSAAAFPQVLATSGDPGSRPSIRDAVVVSSDVAGNDSAWSHVEFSEPVASGTSGLYVFLQLPASSSCVSLGRNGGAGIGYCAGIGRPSAWIVTSEESWDALSGSCQLAIVGDISADKSRAGTAGERKAGTILAPAEPTTSTSAAAITLAAHPNPANPGTEIVFTLPGPGIVDLSLYDLRGAQIRTLIHGIAGPGQHGATWNGRDDRGNPVPSGVYLAKLTTANGSLTSRITLVQ